MAFEVLHTVLFMRHPQTRANTEAFFSGRLDIGITPEGEAMRDRAAAAICAFSPDRLWTSPLSRCHAIADVAGSALGLPVEERPALLECDFGQLEGVRFAGKGQRDMGFPWPVDEQGVSHPAPGAESFEEMYARAEALFAELSQLRGRTACVTHGGMLRAIMGAMYGMPKDRFWYMHIQNVSSIVATCDGERFYLSAFGLTPEEVVARYGTRGTMGQNRQTVLSQSGTIRSDGFVPASQHAEKGEGR